MKCKDCEYQCGYEKGRTEGIDELIRRLDEACRLGGYECWRCPLNAEGCRVTKYAEQVRRRNERNKS